MGTTGPGPFISPAPSPTPPGTQTHSATAHTVPVVAEPCTVPQSPHLLTFPTFSEDYEGTGCSNQDHPSKRGSAQKWGEVDGPRGGLMRDICEQINCHLPPRPPPQPAAHSVLPDGSDILWFHTSSQTHPTRPSKQPSVLANFANVPP